MMVELMYFLLGTVAVMGTLMLLTLAVVVFFDFLTILLKSAFDNYHECKKSYLGPTVEKPKVLPPPPPRATNDECDGFYEPWDVK
jgi:hypothetical protein